jgi:hypothetical protein
MDLGEKSKQSGVMNNQRDDFEQDASISRPSDATTSKKSIIGTEDKRQTGHREKTECSLASHTS